MPGTNRHTALIVSLNYVWTVLFPAVVAVAAFAFAPRPTLACTVIALCLWAAWIRRDPVEYKLGRPDPAFSKRYWAFEWMREYLSVKLHYTKSCQDKLLQHNKTGQAIFAFFPHGVNSDFRMLMDGMMYDAFATVYERAPARTLAASILFKLPSVRQFSLATACVDAGRETATHCLSSGLSLMLCPGGQDEQIETIYGHERVFLRKRSGFIRLALIHGVPVVPSYCFGSSDLYYTSRVLHGVRRWLVRNLRIAVPLYSGALGMYMYPTPVGFPLPVPQNIVFGEPLVFEQVAEKDITKEQIDAAHQKFIAALIALFDKHKAEFGYGDRKLEVL